MKKITALFMMILALAFAFAFCGSAVDYPFYSIEIDDGFYADTENSDTSSVWSNADGSSISISVSPNNGIDFSSVSDFEIDVLTKQIEGTYENLELDSVENVKGSKGEFCSIDSFNYTLDFSVDNSRYSVEGFIFPVEEYLYTVETSSASQEDRDIINKMLVTFELPGEIVYDDNVFAPGESADGIKFVSEDEAFSLELPSGFVEQTAVAPIEKQWVKNDSTISVAVYTAENTAKESMIDLSDEDLDEIAAEFAKSAGADVEGTVVENTTVNGYKGVKIKTTIKTIGLTADTDVYSFSTEDSLIFIYFYRYGEADEQVITDIINSLEINDEILAHSGSNNHIIIAAFVGALIGAVISAVVAKKKKKSSAGSDATFGEYPQV